MRDKSGVPQKERWKILGVLFSDDKKPNDVNQSVSSDNAVKGKQKLRKAYHKFLECFENHVNPVFESYYAFILSHKKDLQKWTNSNCESLSHILTLGAKRKTSKMPELIDLIYQVTAPSTCLI